MSETRKANEAFRQAALADYQALVADLGNLEGTFYFLQNGYYLTLKHPLDNSDLRVRQIPAAGILKIVSRAVKYPDSRRLIGVVPEDEDSFKLIRNAELVPGIRGMKLLAGHHERVISYVDKAFMTRQHFGPKATVVA